MFAHNTIMPNTLPLSNYIYPHPIGHVTCRRTNAVNSELKQATFLIACVPVHYIVVVHWNTGYIFDNTSGMSNVKRLGQEC
jgi:hypothetical protein